MASRREEKEKEEQSNTSSSVQRIAAFALLLLDSFLRSKRQVARLFASLPPRPFRFVPRPP